MAIKNKQLVVHYTAWDTANNVGKTGDVANHTIKVTKDGVEAAATNSPAELSNGVYKITLTAAEMNGSFISVYGSSSTSDIVIIPIHMVTQDPPVIKNMALSNFEFFMVDTNGNPKTGLTVTAERSIDGAAFGACANAVTEVANGMYKIDLAAADLNGDVITLKFTATDAKERMLTVIPAR